MNTTMVALVYIICWAVAAFVAWWLCALCISFVKKTVRSRVRGWSVVVVLVTPFAVAFGATTAVSLLMVLRYAWHLAVITWPDLGGILAPF